MPKAQFTRQITVAQFEALFPDDDACKVYLVARRWPEGVRCPRCSSDTPYLLANKPFHWQCHACSPNKAGYRFSVLVGTIFENTNVSLKVWFKVIHLMMVSKKGIAVLQVQRMFGFGSYRTAHYMCHRIRAGLADPEFRKLVGIVEVDETYVGGKTKNKHADKKTGERGTASKEIVVGAVSRQGSVVACVVANTDAGISQDFVRETVFIKDDLLATDEHASYVGLTDFPHEVMRHGRKKYVVGVAHTNTIEGCWSLIKRGIMGTFHKVSVKYLPLYVAEFEFRHNNRNNPDIFGGAVEQC